MVKSCHKAFETFYSHVDKVNEIILKLRDIAYWHNIMDFANLAIFNRLLYKKNINSF